jgi:UDP-N-acetylglucosamine acyltransferase
MDAAFAPNRQPLRSGVHIHPSAVVAAGAMLGTGVQIGPFCTIGADVSLGDGVRLLSHVVVDGHTAIGAAATLYPFCSIGMAPQDLKYMGEPTRTEIGARTLVREHVTVHRGTVTGHGLTKVGADCMLMSAAHIAHDCQLGDHVIIASNAILGGHVTIDDGAILGGGAAIHQFVRIGRGAMIGGISGVEADVIPFGTVLGNRARLGGLNVIGLRRRGYDRAAIKGLRAAFLSLFRSEGVFADRLAELQAESGSAPLIDELLAFIAAPSKRGLIRASKAVDVEDES